MRFDQAANREIVSLRGRLADSVSCVAEIKSEHAETVTQFSDLKTLHQTAEEQWQHMLHQCCHAVHLPL